MASYDVMWLWLSKHEGPPALASAQLDYSPCPFIAYPVIHHPPIHTSSVATSMNLARGAPLSSIPMIGDRVTWKAVATWRRRSSQWGLLILMGVDPSQWHQSGPCSCLIGGKSLFFRIQVAASGARRPLYVFILLADFSS
jgi:hypothetical protein